MEELFRRGKIRHLNGTVYRVPEDILPRIATNWTLNGLAKWLPDEKSTLERAKEAVSQVQTAAVDAVKEFATKATAPIRKVSRA